MTDSQTFDRLFGAGHHQVRIDGHFVSGPAQVAAAQSAPPADERATQGVERGGRTLAARVAAEVR